MFPFTSTPRTALTALGALALAAAPASAQSLYSMDALGNLTQFTGPPSGACNWPLGPLLSQWSYTQSFLCMAVSPLPGAPNAFGDLAVERPTGSVWVTDGTFVAETQTGGTVVRAFLVDMFAAGWPLSAPLTGMAVDSVNGTLWMTDGSTIVEALPPGAPGCGIDPSALGSFVAPIPSGRELTALDFDPHTNSLWASDDAGDVWNFGPTGALLGNVTPAPPGTCTLSGSLTALAVDAARAGALYVTDGTTVYYMDGATGAPAAPTFYTPQTCSSVPFGPTEGIGFAAAPVSFGSPSNGFFPVIGAPEPSIIPNPAFEIVIAGAEDGEIAVVGISGALVCPGISLGVPTLYLSPFGAFSLGALPVPDTGLVTQPLPLPANLPLGITLHVQGFTIDPTTFEVNSTRGLAFTTTRP